MRGSTQTVGGPISGWGENLYRHRDYGVRGGSSRLGQGRGKHRRFLQEMIRRQTIETASGGWEVKVVQS